MTGTITLWLLLTLPPNPADTEALGTYKTVDSCFEQQLTLLIAEKRDAYCHKLVLPAPVELKRKSKR